MTVSSRNLRVIAAAMLCSCGRPTTISTCTPLASDSPCSDSTVEQNFCADTACAQYQTCKKDAASGCLYVTAAQACASSVSICQMANFRKKIQHIVFIVKENRTFDNYFGQYTPKVGQTIEGATSGLDSGGNTTTLGPLLDWISPDIAHGYSDATKGGCDPGPSHPCAQAALAGFTCSCKNDMFDKITGAYTKTQNHLNYVQVQAEANASKVGANFDEKDVSIPGYWGLAANFVLSDFFFSSHRGPSFVNHLFTIGAQSGGLAADDDDDLVGAYNNPGPIKVTQLKPPFTLPTQPPSATPATWNDPSLKGEPGVAPDSVTPVLPGVVTWGCDAPLNFLVASFKMPAVSPPLSPLSDDTAVAGFTTYEYPCYDFKTLGDELTDAQISWRMYGPKLIPGNGGQAAQGGYIWMIYNAIRHIRGDIQQWFGASDYSTQHVGYASAKLDDTEDLMKDIAGTDGRTLPAVSWISTPAAVCEHPNMGATCAGENWTMKILEAIAAKPDLWNSTAIFITWDDYGGFYDHVSPPDLDAFGLGLRVPFLTVSPYAKAGVVDHNPGEFSSVLKFIEARYGLAHLTTRDAPNNGISDLTQNFDFMQAPLPYPTLTKNICPPTSFFKSPNYLSTFNDGVTYKHMVVVADTNKNRVLAWYSAPNSESDLPNLYFGMGDMDHNVSGPSGLDRPKFGQYDGAHFVIADSGNNRVLIWNTMPTTNYPDADVVLGQVDFNHIGLNAGNGTTASASSLSNPTVAFSDGTHLFVSDSGNNRVLIWSTFPTSNNQAADIVLGQPDMTTSDVAATPSAGSLHNPTGLYVSPPSGSYKGRLFVSDSGNNRVLIYTQLSDWVPGPLVGPAAYHVEGQGDFASRKPNQGSSAAPPAANTLSNPSGIFYDEVASLYVADAGNDRLLVYTLPFPSGNAGNNQDATEVIGQVDFTHDVSGGTAADQLSAPVSAVVAGPDLVVSDTKNDRVLLWNPVPIPPSAAGDATVILNPQ